VGEAAFDELHRSFECDVCWSDEEVNVVWHHDIGMKQVAGAVVIEGFEEKRGVALKLEEPAAVMSSSGNKVRAGSGGTARDRHAGIVVDDAGGAESGPQRLKPRCERDGFGTAKAVPLSKTKKQTTKAVHHDCRLMNVKVSPQANSASPSAC
jgi:hypothetical protein